MWGQAGLPGWLRRRIGKTGFVLAWGIRKTFPGCAKAARGLELNMANTPKKVKDPTEVALSAIQEALNIGDGVMGGDRGPSRNDEPTVSANTPQFEESPFETRMGNERMGDERS